MDGDGGPRTERHGEFPRPRPEEDGPEGPVPDRRARLGGLPEPAVGEAVVDASPLRRPEKGVLLRARGRHRMAARQAGTGGGGVGEQSQRGGQQGPAGERRSGGRHDSPLARGGTAVLRRPVDGGRTMTTGRPERLLPVTAAVMPRLTRTGRTRRRARLSGAARAPWKSLGHQGARAHSPRHTGPGHGGAPAGRGIPAGAAHRDGRRAVTSGGGPWGPGPFVVTYRRTVDVCVMFRNVWMNGVSRVTRLPYRRLRTARPARLRPVTADRSPEPEAGQSSFSGR